MDRIYSCNPLIWKQKIKYIEINVETNCVKQDNRLMQNTRVIVLNKLTT